MHVRKYACLISGILSNILQLLWKLIELGGTIIQSGRGVRLLAISYISNTLILGRINLREWIWENHYTMKHVNEKHNYLQLLRRDKL